MNGTALVFGLWKHLSNRIQHPQTLVTNDEFYAVQAAATEPLKEVNPTGLVLFHTLSSTQNFTISVLIDGDCNQNGHIFILSAPISAQIDAIHIDIRIAATLQRAVTPFLNVDIGFLIQLADGGGRYLAAPQGLSDVLHTPDGYTCQVHLNESLFHAAFPPTVPLNNSRLKGDPFEFGYLESDIPGSGGEIAVVMTAAVALALLITLVPSRLGQFLCLGFQQLVEGLLYAATHQLFDLTLDYIFI